MLNDIDIKEIELFEAYPEAFRRLLRDHSRFARFKSSHPEYDEKTLSEHADDPENLIIWATDDYADKGDGYSFHDPITLEKITGENGMLIRPRCEKSAEEQMRRVKDKAEVFTPSWVCNAQNNLVDEAWFGRKDVFNREITDERGKHSWMTIPDPITDFPEGKSWRNYVRDTRMEITCGEAPYLASRYDTTTGEFIPTANRIGLLDRKLRIVSENCHTSSEWLTMAQAAFQNIYGYEWQGDNLLLARESLLYTFLEFYHNKFGKMPQAKSIDYIAYIVSWNIWQMDGLKMVTPMSCTKKEVCVNQKEIDKATNDPFRLMFPEDAGPIPEPKYELQECPGCTTGDDAKHTGIYAQIRDWRVHDNNHKDKDSKTGKERCDIRFIDIVNKKNENK